MDDDIYVDADLERVEEKCVALDEVERMDPEEMYKLFFSPG